MKDSEKTVLVRMLQEIVESAVPGASTVPKYGGILYTLRPDEKESQFCGIFKYKNHVQLAIRNVPPLADPDRLLQGTGKTRRHLNFESVDDIDADAIIPFLKQAAAG